LATAPKRQIIVNDSVRETRVAILEEGRLVELIHAGAGETRLKGNIYWGVVEAVVPGLQAAFVDIGHEKAGFLHASDLLTEPDEDDPSAANPADAEPARIQDAVQKGQSILVQVTKEPISTKGSRVTSQVSLPGRFIVYMPASDHVGVSRKITAREDRASLRQMARKLLGEGAPDGVIVRTAGEGLTEDVLKKELARLRGAWKKIQRRAKGKKAPALVHEDASLTQGIIRDLFNDRVDQLRVDSAALHQEIKSYLGEIDKKLMQRVELYEGDGPVFDHFGVEDEIRRAFHRTARLPSGGQIVVEETEALVSIDVNTGRFTGKGKKDPADTILKTNMEAASEVARQLRLRDIGGIVVIDFIDMDTQQHRDKVVSEMRRLLSRDRARTKVFAISELGLMQVSRQRVNPSLKQRMTSRCAFCWGKGNVLSPEAVLRRVERALVRASADRRVQGLSVVLHPSVVLHLLEHEREFLDRAREETGLTLELADSPLLDQDGVRLLQHPGDQDVSGRFLPN